MNTIKALIFDNFSRFIAPFIIKKKIRITIGTHSICASKKKKDSRKKKFAFEFERNEKRSSNLVGDINEIVVLFL